jgi:hypothetical protein
MNETHPRAEIFSDWLGRRQDMRLRERGKVKLISVVNFPRRVDITKAP